MPSSYSFSKLRSYDLFLCVVALVVTALCAVRPIQNLAGYHRYPLDAYYYFDMAQNLVSEGTMLVRFEQGVPNKFFPGYPLLLSVMTIWSPPHVGWPWLQTILAIAVAVLMYCVARAWGASPTSSLSGVIILAANPVFNKWVSAPAAETAAVAWLLASAWLAACTSGASRWFLPAATGILVGAASVTRPDATYFILAVGALLYTKVPRLKLQHWIAYLAAGIAPLIALLVSRQFATGSVTYVTEFTNTATDIRPFIQFLSHSVRLIRDPHALHPDWWINILLVATQMVLYVAVIASMAFLFGRKLALLAWLAFGYLAAHSFWYYTSDRFNMLILPMLALLLSLVIERCLKFRMAGKTLSLPRGWAYALLIAVMVVPMELYAGRLIRYHQEQLASDGGRPHRLAEIANNPPGVVWSEAGPDFAYFCRGRVYFDHDLPNFYARTQQAGEFFARNRVRWIVSHEATADGWFARHPDVTSSTVALVPRARDGFFTLFSVGGR